MKPKPVRDLNSRFVEEIDILPEKRREILNKFRQILSYYNYKISKLLIENIEDIIPKRI